MRDILSIAAQKRIGPVCETPVHQVKAGFRL